MGAARKLEKPLEVRSKTKLPVAKGLLIAALSLPLLFALFAVTDFAIHWYSSDARVEMHQQMDRGEMEKPWFSSIL